MAEVEINLWPKFLEAAVTPVAKEAGERLADIVSLACTPLVRAKARRDLKMKLFMEDLEKELKKIPEAKIVEPPLSVVGPALEDMFKYYMDESHITAAFLKLIAAAMDEDKQGLIHPLHSWMIRQMSPADAATFQKMAGYAGLYSTQLYYTDDTNLDLARLHVWDSELHWGEDTTFVPMSEAVEASLLALATVGLVRSTPLESHTIDYDLFEEMIYLSDSYIRQVCDVDLTLTLREHFTTRHELTAHGDSLCAILGIARYQPGGDPVQLMGELTEMLT